MALIDKKSRTSIMYGVMICLFVAIVFCVIKIATRPPVVMDEDRANYYLPASEKIDFSELENQIAEKKEEVHIEVEDRARLIEDNVNIRTGPGTEYDRLGSAYKGFDYKVLGDKDSEWIKIEYDGKTAYVFSEYVEVVPMFLNDEGEYEEYVTFDDTSSSNENASDTETTQDSENPEDTDDN